MSQLIVKVLDLCKSALSKEVAKHDKVVNECQAKEKAEEKRYQGELDALYREHLTRHAAARNAHNIHVNNLFYREGQAQAKKEGAQQYLNKLS